MFLLPLVAGNINFLSEMFIDLKKECNKIGLQVKTEKTKYLKKFPGEVTMLIQKVNIVADSFEAVSEFKCLRTTLNNENMVSKGINNIITAGNRVYLQVL